MSSDPILELLQRLCATWKASGTWTDLDGVDSLSILDAGTGRQSLGWLVQLPCAQWTAVTRELPRQLRLQSAFAPQMTERHRILCFDWTARDEVRANLGSQQFDLIIADYFFGSLDRYHPHSLGQVAQEITSRLQAHGRLVVVGRQPQGLSDVEGISDGPAPTSDSDQVEGLFEWLHRLRDGTLLLCGQQPHREVPANTLRLTLESLGLLLNHECWLENQYQMDFFQRELSALRLRLQEDILPKGLARAILREVEDLQRQAQEITAQKPNLCYDKDYVLVFQRAHPRS